MTRAIEMYDTQQVWLQAGENRPGADVFDDKGGFHRRIMFATEIRSVDGIPNRLAIVAAFDSFVVTADYGASRSACGMDGRSGDSNRG
jgi:hypothetical protein